MPSVTDESVYGEPMEIPDFQFSVPASNKTNHLDNNVALQTHEFTVPAEEQISALGRRTSIDLSAFDERTRMSAIPSSDHRQVRFKSPVVDAEWQSSGLPNVRKRQEITALPTTIEEKRSYTTKEDTRIPQSPLPLASEQGALEEALGKIDNLGHGIANDGFQTRLRILHTLRFNQLGLEQHAIGVFMKARDEVALLRAELVQLRDEMALATSTAGV